MIVKASLLATAITVFNVGSGCAESVVAYRISDSEVQICGFLVLNDGCKKFEGASISKEKSGRDYIAVTAEVSVLDDRFACSQAEQQHSFSLVVSSTEHEREHGVPLQYVRYYERWNNPNKVFFLRTSTTKSTTPILSYFPKNSVCEDHAPDWFSKNGGAWN